MKRILAIILTVSMVLAGCSAGGAEESVTETTAATQAVETVETTEPVPVAQPTAGTQIVLSDESITVDGENISTDETAAVHTANSIVYYEEGHDFTYGEGSEADAHSAEEAAAHTVVTITQPGVYALTGKLSAGQIAVDLGEEAEDDPEAVVTLILNNVDITCTVAPAVIFYNVYECGSTDTETATYEVDTSAAGANVFIADGSVNTINGSYVARIYKPDSVELSEDGTEVADAKKLHKYDAAFYSKMSMNVTGNDGVLNITAENEGLDSELHLTVNGGNITIRSGNDGINTNEDGVSVTTINGGDLSIYVTGTTGEGDGIDSNGWLVINGGKITAEACSISGDAGIDSDMGIYLNGGTVIATGNMLDQIAGGDQTYVVFQFAQSQKGGSTYTLKSESGDGFATFTPGNDFSYLIFAHDALVPGNYTLWCGDTQLSGSGGQGMGGMMGGGMKPDGEMPEGGEIPQETFAEAETFPGGEMPEMPEGEMPEGMTPPEGMGEMTPPEDMEEMTPPEGGTMPEGEAPQDMGQGGFGGGDRGQMGGFGGESSTTFPISEGSNYFTNVTEVTQ